MTAQHILISRTDNLGDVIFTLPMAGLIKANAPDTKISFLGKSYTTPILKSCKHIDNILKWDEMRTKNQKQQAAMFKQLKINTIIHVFPRKRIAKIAKKAKIPVRIGTWRRLYHLWYCNKWVNLTRKNADQHEAQLNLKLLAPLNIKEYPPLHQLYTYYGFSNRFQLNDNLKKLPDLNKFNLIIHPKSKGNAKEWKVEKFIKLIRQLPAKKFNIFITGTEAEANSFQNKLPDLPHLHNLSGKTNIQQLIAFIDRCDGLVAASTGPLHIAAALGKHAIGLFAPMRPIHPGRWQPLGIRTKVFSLEKPCQQCRKKTYCKCINTIPPAQVASHLNQQVEKKNKK